MLNYTSPFHLPFHHKIPIPLKLVVKLCPLFYHKISHHTEYDETIILLAVELFKVFTYTTQPASSEEVFILREVIRDSDERIMSSKIRTIKENICIKENI